MTDIALEREALALFEAALDMAEDEREAWLTARAAGRPALLERVRAMLAADRAAALRTGMAADQAAAEEEAMPARIGAYRIVERIGRGGMGSVYLGERAAGDFAHRVAIKVIKPGLLSEALIERFRRERQLLATLSHPNIAQLYDGGETDAGSPYFIMELVDGLPLLAWVEAHQPSRAERQRLFGDICAAVAFAHRSLVVHRDLTPSNVLVTRDGVAKLIDFGIARAADNPDTAPIKPPSIGSLSLTPGYAAPERMTGAAVTTAADIFSLGKMLQKMIPPGPGDGELSAIVARATAHDPAARYPTADALGADVRAWASGFRVAAMNGGRRYGLAKFVGRHRLGVGAAAVAVLLLIGAFALTLVANARAQAARAVAEQRFQQTRSIAKSLLFDAFDQVSRVPGSTRARAYLARTGLAYIDTLAADRGAPPDLRLEAGNGYLRLAQVVGGGLASQLGRYEDANALLARSEEILAPLLRDHPGDPQMRAALAALLIEQSAVSLYNNNDVDLSRRQAERARQLIAAPAARLEAARLYANATRAEGDTYLWAEDYARARAILTGVETFIAGLPPAMQRDPQLSSIRAQSLRLLGEAHHKLDETADAQRVLDRAVNINRAVLATQLGDPLYRRRVVTSLRYRAIVHRTNHRDQLARESIEEAGAVARILRDADRDDMGALQLYAVVSEVHAMILADLGRYPEAYRIGDEVRDAYREMVTRAGDAPGQLRSLAMAMRSNAGVHYNGGDYAGACRIWREIMVILNDLDRRGVLTETDRGNAMAETRGYLANGCNPPRSGLGIEL